MALEAISERLPFFVYGTLRTGEENWSIFLKGRTEQEIPAALPGHRMFVDEFPFFMDSPDCSRVTGNLVFPKEALYGQVMEDLDGLEQYDPESGTGWYLRVVREVQYVDETGCLQRVKAWVYHGGPEVTAGLAGKIPVPSGDWLAYLGKEPG